MNDKVFSLIDYTDAPYEDGNEIQKFYSLNLITGVDVTNSVPHLIFPGAFLNDMAANFYIIYDKGNLTIEPGTLSVETKAFSSNYGAILTDKDIPTTFATVDTNFELIEAIFLEGIPYYFEKVGGDDTKYTLGGPIKMEVGVYNIFITDLEDNYTINYGDNHGTLTITPANLTVETTTAANIEYGGAPGITTVISGFPFKDDGNDLNNEDVSTLFLDGIPYFFMKQGEIPDCEACIKYYLPYAADTDKMDVGIYDIFITDDPNDNYKIQFAADRGTLIVEPATLTVTTTAFSVEYGDSVSDVISTEISGFTFEDENVSNVFTEGIPYLFNGYNTVTELGSYLITVETHSDNYVIDYSPEHGGLTINSKELFPETAYYKANYGDFVLSNLSTEFGFVYGELESDVYTDGVPYTFVKDGVTYQKTDRLEVGIYDIKIDAPVSGNYVINSYGSGHSKLDITPATLNVTISPPELIVNQGDTPALIAEFTGFVNEEVVNDVFPTGIPYSYEGEPGIFDDTSVPGVFTVRIEDPTNYEVEYNEATLFVNPFNDEIKKVRTYADCVSNNQDGTYTVTYRYENDNDDAVFAAGDDNILSGPAEPTATGTLPTIFMPGSGTFEIIFNGEQLVWSLTTYEGTHKSSVSSASTSGANVCDAKLDGAYAIGPNPVFNKLTITQNIVETSWVYVYNMNGIILRGANQEYEFDGTNVTEITIDTSTLIVNALYVVRIQSENGDVRSYNIIKQQ